jgi:hypothetical protein
MEAYNIVLGRLFRGKTGDLKLVPNTEGGESNRDKEKSSRQVRGKQGIVVLQVQPLQIVFQRRYCITSS